MTDETAPDTEQVVEVTLKVKIQPRAMFLLNAGADVSEGPFKGTSLGTHVGSGFPVVYVQRDGKSLATAWIDPQELIGAMIDAVVTNIAGRTAPDGE